MDILTMLAQEVVLSPEKRTSAVIWLCILGAIVIVGGVVIMLVRRKFTEPEKGGDEVDTGFSLSSLREMRDRGEITPEEYDKARAKIIEKIKGSGG